MSYRKIHNLPKHKNPTNEGRIASAPYNFVPLPEVMVAAVDSADQLPDHDCYYSDRHTGYFEVLLTTRSPLYIRCPLTVERFLRQERGEDAKDSFRKQVRNTPEFFYTRDPNRPVIPGSSLRGMLRSVLEIVSYGKMQWVTDKRLFFRTMDKTAIGDYYRSRMAKKVETGFLSRKGNKFVIKVCPMARVYRNKLKGNLYDGSESNKTPCWSGQTYQWMPVWVKLSRNPDLVDDIRCCATYGFEEGRLVITGNIKNKEFVFLLPREEDEEIEVPDVLIERFHDNDQITQWQEKAFPKDKPSPNCRERDGMLRKEPKDPGDPVFFLRENGRLTFFGRAQMFRLPYSKSPIDLVPGDLRRLEDIDYAEALFGYTKNVKASQGSKARAYAGRVFVTDAILEKNQVDYWLSEEPIVPHILATPKPTAFQHYLTQEKPDEEKQLYYYDKEHTRPHRHAAGCGEKQLYYYDNPPNSTTIRGYKRYWHQGERTREDIKAFEVPEESTQHTQFKPVKAGVRFRFNVYFENLSDRELGALCWVLHPLGNSNKEYCHQLGMGKPLGIGAVQLQAKLHITEREKRYTSLFNGDSWETGATDTGKSLSDVETLKLYTKTFEEHILSVLGLKCTHLCEVKRIGMLLKMLEWPGFPSDSGGDLFLKHCNRPNTRYMRIQSDKYRKRPVLPDPIAFDSDLKKLL